MDATIRSRRSTSRTLPTNDTGPDAQLVQRAKHGDSEAFGLLYHRYFDRLLRFTGVRLGSREDAEDATQATFLRIAMALPRCRDDTQFASWVFTIARNVVVDARRAGRREVGMLDEVTEVTDPAASPEELALDSAGASELNAACARCLTPRERELLALRLHGFPDREIATRLGMSECAVRAANYRAMRKLRACLDGDGAPGERRAGCPPKRNAPGGTQMPPGAAVLVG
jgi:RNA polymerase sigma-70 factor (ECF subfamily)